VVPEMDALREKIANIGSHGEGRKMSKTLLAIAAATVLVSIQGHAKELSDAEWHKKFDNCLMTDNRPDGTEFCVKSSTGMSQSQIDAFFRKEGERAYAPYIAGYKNCLRESEDAKRLGGWYGKPSAEDCQTWANAVITKGRDMIDKGIKEMMEAH
jgi:hypothetical protein